ncbi:YibE/F family protein [Spirochaetota bacterium]
MKFVKTMVYLKVLDGEDKDKIKTALFGGESDLPGDMNYKVGDTVFIGILVGGDKNSTRYVSIYDFDNSVSIIILVILLIAAIVIIGRLKGIASLISLVVTILLLFLILIPLTLKGYPPLPIAVAIAIVSILMTLPIIAGLKKKTLAAILGAAGGIVIATLLAISFGWIMHLSGIVTNDMLTIYYASDVNIDLRGLVLSGMIIAALGAIMDVCISIASSTAEIYRANPGLSEKEAFKSVLTIGTDILGSMVNTLILAYVGSSLALILWISMKIQPGMSFWMVLNYNPVLNEIVKAVIGSLGMFVSIPLTAIIAVKIHSNKT